MTSSRSSAQVARGSPAVSESTRVWAVRTASRSPRAAAASTWFVVDDSSTVSRSSSAVTRGSPTCQPPATRSRDPLSLSWGTCSRASQATSSRAASKPSRQRRRRLARTASRAPTAPPPTTTAASNHHTQGGTPSSLDASSAEGDDSLVEGETSGLGVTEVVSTGAGCELVSVGVSVGSASTSSARSSECEWAATSSAPRSDSAPPSWWRRSRRRAPRCGRGTASGSVASGSATPTARAGAPRRSRPRRRHNPRAAGSPR